MTIPVQTLPQNLPQANSTSVAQMDPLVAMIERAARDPSIDLERMERLLQMQERAHTRQLEADFNDAMSAAQTEMRAVATDANNPQTKSKYASYFALDKAIRPHYTKQGISLSFDTDDAAVADHVRIICFVSKGGFTRKYHVDMPADGKGAKGGDVMTKTHAMGAAMTYGQRYLLRMIFNIAIGEDRDGNGVGTVSPKVTDVQVAEIEHLLGNNMDKIIALMKYLGVESLADMTVATYERAKRSIEAKQKMAAHNGEKP
jgi:hypothetical protein